MNDRDSTLAWFRNFFFVIGVNFQMGFILHYALCFRILCLPNRGRRKMCLCYFFSTSKIFMFFMFLGSLKN